MRAAVAALALLLSSGAAGAAELVMFETGACPWCLKWHREVGPAYPKTDEGRLLPLRRVEITAPRAADLAGLDGVKYTPTFVVMACGREQGRILGYPSEESFYGELAALAAKVQGETARCAR